MSAISKEFGLPWPAGALLVEVAHFITSALSIAADGSVIVTAPIGATAHTIFGAVGGVLSGSVVEAFLHALAEAIGDATISEFIWNLNAALSAPGPMEAMHVPIRVAQMARVVGVALIASVVSMACGGGGPD